MTRYDRSGEETAVIAQVPGKVFRWQARGREAPVKMEEPRAAYREVKKVPPVPRLTTFGDTWGVFRDDGVYRSPNNSAEGEDALFLCSLKD